MTVHTTWLKEESCIIQLQFEEKWSWRELEESIKTAHDMKDQYEQQGTLVLNLEQSMPLKIGVLSKAKNLLTCSGKRFKHIIFVGTPTTLEYLLKILTSRLIQPNLMADIQFIAHSDQLDAYSG